MGVDINIRVTGGAGQGLHTVGGLLGRLAIATGHHFHATQDYMSRIRGGRNSYSVRIREIHPAPVSEPSDLCLGWGSPGQRQRYQPVPGTFASQAQK